MAYAQHVQSPKGDYHLSRYLDGNGKYATVKDPQTGKPVHYTRKRDAKKAGDAQEAAVREGRWKDPDGGTEEADGPLFEDWANDWYASLELAPSTMASYRDHLELHILPEFTGKRMKRIYSVHIGAWEKKLRAAAYAEASVRTYRGTLHACLEAAVPAVIAANPAHRKPNTGRRTGRKSRADSGAEKTITGILGGLLIAERMSILSGRDDEFIMTQALQFGALRLGEGVGLERQYVQPGAIRVEWQLSEVTGKLIRGIPKFGSRGTVTIPPFMERLLDRQLKAVLPAECPCHGYSYVFRGMGKPRGAPKNGITIRTVAKEAGVSMATVSNAITRPEEMNAVTREHVLGVIRRLGWIPGAAAAEPAWHWRRSAFEELITAAASGRFPARKPLPERPVPLTGEWPGTRVHGRNAQGRAAFSWLPVAEGLTPHGLRHSQRTWMGEQKIHHELAEAQMRHELGGIDVYRHVTEAMREEYRGLVQAAWEEALQRRGEMSPASPVKVLAVLLEEASGTADSMIVTRISQETRRPVLRARR